MPTGRSRDPAAPAAPATAEPPEPPPHDHEGTAPLNAIDPARTWGHPLWLSLLPIGRDPKTGGYRRYSFTKADSACRDWFRRAAEQRDLRIVTDRNANLWAWWDVGEDLAWGEAGGTQPAPAGFATPGADGMPSAPGSRHSGLTRSDVAGAIVTGSHLDSVPDGGAFDGPLGIVCAFAAIDLLRERGFVPVRPVGVVAFVEEEGARFGMACLGSRLLTGVVTPDAARALTDSGGITLEQAMTQAGFDAGAIGPDAELVADIAAHVELHIEQGSALDGKGAAIGVGESIWPHGRWRLDFTGRADHAGTTRLADRRDPMLPYAATVLAARAAATAHGALATFGKVIAEPGGSNAICSAVRAWLDARAPDETSLSQLISEVEAVAERCSAEHGVRVSIRCESLTPVVDFDRDLRDRVAATLAAAGIDAPVLPTGAGHDAGVLAARLPAAMLFVRNPTGVSHSPAEHAQAADCETGVRALAAVLADLAGQ